LRSSGKSIIHFKWICDSFEVLLIEYWIIKVIVALYFSKSGICTARSNVTLTYYIVNTIVLPLLILLL
jgi:hypothetical protein